MQVFKGHPRLAAQRAGDAVLSINPHLLIIVQGLQAYPDPAARGGVATSWWGGILRPVRQYPVVLNQPHQLVYSVHDWGPRKHDMPWFAHLTKKSLERAWHQNWSFLLDNPEAPYAAPLFLGEFGTCTENTQCIASQVPDSQGAWFQMLLRFLRRHQDVAWSFYALNGTNSNNCAADNGLLNPRWNNVSSRALQASLLSAQASPGMLPSGAGPLLPNTTPEATPRNPRSRLCTLP